MGTIVKHIFSKKDNIPVYANENGTKVLGYLSIGEWMGLIKDSVSRAKIISSKIDGWVNRSDFLVKNFNLTHLSTEYNNGEIKYFLSV